MTVPAVNYMLTKLPRLHAGWRLTTPDVKSHRILNPNQFCTQAFAALNDFRLSPDDLPFFLM